VIRNKNERIKIKKKIINLAYNKKFDFNSIIRTCNLFSRFFCKKFGPLRLSQTLNRTEINIFFVIIIKVSQF
jgi:hypothetical protein